MSAADSLPPMAADESLSAACGRDNVRLQSHQVDRDGAWCVRYARLVWHSFRAGTLRKEGSVRIHWPRPRGDGVR